MMPVVPANYQRSKRAFSFAEVAATSFLIVFIAVFVTDICLAIFACSVNDQACRDAVRAASQQPNAAKAQLFAKASVKNHKTDGFFISPISLSYFYYNDYGGNPPVGQSPYVQAITSVNVTLPAPIYFFGASFTNKFQFSQQYTSPIVRTKLILP